MWLKWLPWKLAIRYAARSHGFLDPISLLGRLRRFAEPSEVAEPLELLRAGVEFHARGLINSRVIQHNLDWVWPFWVERQFDPADPAFIPRAFSITHVNLTHRNWTAVGLPDDVHRVIVDPRGLVTPLSDGWSLDAWVIDHQGRWLLPARSSRTTQQLECLPGLAVHTETSAEGLSLATRARVVEGTRGSVLELDIEGAAAEGGWLVCSVRPYNPEGVSLIHKIGLTPDRRGWEVDGAEVRFGTEVVRHHVSDYRAGDVFIHLNDAADNMAITCDVGMATGAALFPLAPAETGRVAIEVPLVASAETSSSVSWSDVLADHCRLSLADSHIEFLYDAAVRTLVLLSPGDVYPGPYTYKRFWFRDAVFMLHALASLGFRSRVERAIEKFGPRQAHDGHFCSQEGEWDSNGQVLWLLDRFKQLHPSAVDVGWRRMVSRAARWIAAKRLPAGGATAHAGLLPAGFSAEHLGPNDYYYWDDYWGLAGLEAAARLAVDWGQREEAHRHRDAAGALAEAIELSLEKVALRLGVSSLPASPYRRMDAGCIGSLVAGYPLEIYGPREPRLLGTVEYLIDHCFVSGGFFQDMVHSGINPYLTLQVAQVLLRAGDERFADMLRTVAALASPTGQWPEAIHPHTGGGCMGDGQHAWAAAEWVLLLRNCLIRDPPNELIVGSGFCRDWVSASVPLRFGPVPTRFGEVTLNVARPHDSDVLEVDVRGRWHGPPPPIRLEVPGYEPSLISACEASTRVLQPREASCESL